MMNPCRILAEILLAIEPLERQGWEISIKTDHMGIRYTDKKWMELGTLSSVPSDLQAPLPYHTIECGETTDFSLTRDCAVLNIAVLWTSLMAVSSFTVKKKGL
jgi:hypothetical protein